jgi:hypothetical protein
MGAHSIGTLSRKNSGFNGPQGWNKNKFVLSNSYYASLVGGTNGSLDSLQTKLDVPNWNLVLVNNSDIPNIPNRFQWQRSAFIMLDADIALVRNVEDYIDASTGEVTCTFLPKNTVVPACPYASVTLDFAAEYKKDNTIWLNDFRDVFSSMLVHGYDASGTCGSATCVLTSKLVS